MFSKVSIPITWALVLAILPAVSAAQTGIPVEVQPLSAVLVDLERSASAEVRSLNRASLAAQVAAPVSAIHADVAQNVNAGDLLIELDPSDYALALEQAEAALASLIAQKARAEARLRRARELGANKYLSDDELLARETDAMVIEAQIEAQKVTIAIARRNLEKCQILAPFNGVVTQRQAQLGAYVAPGSLVLDLVERDRYELDAEIPEEIAASLSRAVTMHFVSRNESWPVRLLRLSPVVEPERRTRRARFAFEDEAPAVGRSGEVRWRVERGLLPASLVVQRNGTLGVFLVEENRAVFTPLPGAQEGRPVAITLPQDARIAVAGRGRLQDGDVIESRRATAQP